MRTPIKLRYPKKEDLEKLLELDEIACFATTGRPLSNRERQRKMILFVIKDEPCLIKVAEIDKKIAGFGWLGTDPMRDSITSLAVLPEFQRQGVGSKLIVELENQARKMQIKRLTLHTGIANKKARNFFDRMGYKEVEVKLEKVISKDVSEKLNSKYPTGR